MKIFFLLRSGNVGHAGGSDERFGKVNAPVIKSVLGLFGVLEPTDSIGVQADASL
jgi:hypothetical protein